jgi:hypothetical protein
MNQLVGSENLRRIEPLLQTLRDVAKDVGAADMELSTQSRDALTDAARAFRPVSTLYYFSERIQEKLGRR